MSSVTEPPEARYLVGIDLGTTNCAVAFIDLEDTTRTVTPFAVPQLTSPGQVEQRDTLPSFHYEPATNEFAPDQLKLPWTSEEAPQFVGAFARDHGARVPGRQVQSAKSWLCHAGIDRTAAVLPWHAASDVERISPVAASARYLEHIRLAWDDAYAEHPLAEQDIVLTIPASFDEVARELTVRAAREAGLPKLVLIEEPQAAFYAWINRRRDDWPTQVDAGQTILVCDIGGGTTDFSLIRVRANDNGTVGFDRIAVGEHLVLGGDNVDLAVAKLLEESANVPGGLQPAQWETLARLARRIKEDLLAEDAPETVTVSVSGGGSKLIGSALQIEARRDVIREAVIDGFLPKSALKERPLRRASGFQEFGLPYAADAAITKQLAAFLTDHREVVAKFGARDDAADPARPDVVLFNGGFFESPLLKERLLETLSEWFDPTHQWRPKVLAHDRLDLAVARGAAYYGLVRRGEGVRIDAGLARSYYIAISSADGSKPQAVCLAPAGTKEGSEIELAQQFEVLVSQPVEFPIFVSSTRSTDDAGDVVGVDPLEMRPLAPIRTVLRSRGKSSDEAVAVHVVTRLTEIGTLDLQCREVDGNRRWKIQFDVRAATRTEVDVTESTGETAGILDEEVERQAAELIEQTFGPEKSLKPRDLPRRLSEVIGEDRDNWPAPLLRSMWETLFEHREGRRFGPAHEARWLNMTGFAMRPGYGVALDDWRVSETWKGLKNQLVHADPRCLSEWRVFWRRLSGGLEAGQQRALADPLLSVLAAKPSRQQRGAIAPAADPETWRMLSSLERLPVQMKRRIADLAVVRLNTGDAAGIEDALIWSLGRLAARVPLYGPQNEVVGRSDCERLIEQLLVHKSDSRMLESALVQMSRRSGDRFRDVGEKVRDRVLGHLTRMGASDRALQLVEEGGSFGEAERAAAFGDALPSGLRLIGAGE
ncbi:hsp70 family protein [Stratiformator vulcanicus]|uniref:Chaperone protein HscA n=1 Tax=Stratiformator vulcanicus TaxID=2527980 RepID=A0A517R1L7_9PLAN|nr:hsp70 family protein [Stratiformator vulcanicus]QDT37787.1 Chaperone protein HscA [Stratiformator vulcanicus]